MARAGCSASAARSAMGGHRSTFVTADLVEAFPRWYQIGMKSNTKSSVTLPAEELRLVRRLKTRLKLKSNVDVVRAGLRLLSETTEREALREQFKKASQETAASCAADLSELDHLAAEGLD